MVDLAKRSLLRGRLTQKTQLVVMRPPWSAAEDTFTNECTQCNQCIEACPTKVIQKGEGGYPELNFAKDECDFCEDCIKACPTKAIDQTNPKTNQFFPVLTDNCLAQKNIYCRSCGENCEPQAIEFKYINGAIAQPQINLDACIQCGACVSPCPTQAVQFKPLAQLKTTNQTLQEQTHV
ncbi:ferredoxin-type protein NapF [Catenovulum maritimum]|uniref:4Fe-4S ferredoxin-type domain-containing protein n=1 Tax=Catenovulum maritimum TaxID=1513271 RepID=A0A0J8GTS8_9ALTE|nr:ferredoxin-type protein NapF [Catenovulum maritimum]KMT64093.1 hypothetical protein XM47_16035 [Catenovulum maritimum]